MPNINQGAVVPNKIEGRRLKIDKTSDRQQRNGERRRRPDRRRRQLPISIQDRRKQQDRRQPKLLNAKSAQPEKISSQKGRTIDTKV